MNADALVLHDGDQVSAWGRLVRDDRGDWFEPPRPRTLIYYEDPPVDAAWSGAVPVVGADFDDLEDRRERAGLTEGWATVTGTWSAGRLRAEHQDPRRPDQPANDFPAWDVPPGPPPADGWPSGRDGSSADSLEFDLGDLKATGAAVAVTVFRPGRRQAVLVVAAADPAPVEARLRPQLGASLCVVPSRWSRRELDEVRRRLHDHWEDWNIYRSGEINDSDGQATVIVGLARVRPGIAAWVAELPPGILALQPWLAPA
jgi:hypothetical protein